MLVNLLSNALKYSPADSPVSLRLAARDGEFALFTVADRGRGIPAADQARLFQSFQRGSNVSDTPGPASDSCWSRSVWISTAAASNSPARKDLDHLCHPPSHFVFPSDEGTRRSHRMKTILIIGDEAHRENLCTILEMEGYRAIGAVDGQAGLELVARERPDLVLCDVTMPRLDGHGVLLKLRTMPCGESIPFIFLTAKSDRPDVRTGMNLGADDYLTKPASAEEVLAAVETRLIRRQILQKAQTSLDFSSSPAPRSTRADAQGGGSAAVGRAGKNQRRRGRHSEHGGEDGKDSPLPRVRKASCGNPHGRGTGGHRSTRPRELISSGRAPHQRRRRSGKSG